jgi:hypothetical protein
MPHRIERLLDHLTAEGQAELEAFAAFLIARRTLGQPQVPTADISPEELVELVMQAGSFDWLSQAQEDGYSLADGDQVAWPGSAPA